MTYMQNVKERDEAKAAPKSKVALKELATSDGRRFPVGEVKDALTKELALVRARLNRQAPDDIAVKIFVIDALEEIMGTRRQVIQSHLIRILKEIKADYMAFEKEKT